MVKTILIALDPALDLSVAIQYAAEVAGRYDATVTGLAVIDMKHIEAEAHGGGIGSMYFAERLRENLTAEARATAEALLKAFEAGMDEAGLRYGELVEEGVPFRRIIEDMKYRDLLIMGKDPHFFYSHPEQRTRTLANVVRDTIAPTLVVGQVYRPVRRVLIAYSGSTASARAMRRFVHLQPFGRDVEVDLLNVYRHDAAESALLLRLAKDYLGTHGLTAQTVSLQGERPHEQIVGYAAEQEVDLVVAGTRLTSRLRQLAFMSTTTALIDACPVPLFLDH